MGYSPWGLKSQTKLSDSAPPPTAHAIPDPNLAASVSRGECLSHSLSLCLLCSLGNGSNDSTFYILTLFEDQLR